jgi:hypothetical protein
LLLRKLLFAPSSFLGGKKDMSGPKLIRLSRYAYSPLFVLFEPDPPMPEEPIDPNKTANISDTALMIPCYKAATLIGATLESATKIFPPSHIFVVANGRLPLQSECSFR